MWRVFAMRPGRPRGPAFSTLLSTVRTLSTVPTLSRPRGAALATAGRVAGRRHQHADPRWSSSGQRFAVSQELRGYSRQSPLYALIAANVAVWGWYTAYGSGTPSGRRWFATNMLLSNSRFSARPYVVLTSMFSHVEPFHLFANMFTLWSFGSASMEMLGPSRFLALYFASGAAGGLAHLAYSRYMPGTRWPASYTVRRDDAALGASGAIAGLTMYTATRMYQGTTVLFIFPVPNPLFVLLFVGGSAYYCLYNTGSSGGFAHSAHLGGAAVGMGYAVFRTLMRR